MKEEELINVIEKINYDYLDSKEYQIGSYVYFLKKLYEKRKFKELFKLVLHHFKRNKARAISPEKTCSEKPISINTPIKDKIAVYTCITGDYDKVASPYIYEENCDYILFTNNPNLKSDFWQVRFIPDEIQTIGDNILINRYVKMHPHEVLKGYDYSIYIDGNIRLVAPITQFTGLINAKTGLAIHRHNKSKGLNDELLECRAYSKGNYRKLKEQVESYFQEGMPEKFGLYECNMLISDLKNNSLKNIMSSWWDEFINSESKRDQFSLPYVIWKSGFDFDEVGIIGDNINLNPCLKIISHK